MLFKKKTLKEEFNDYCCDSQSNFHDAKNYEVICKNCGMVNGRDYAIGIVYEDKKEKNQTEILKKNGTTLPMQYTKLWRRLSKLNKKIINDYENRTKKKIEAYFKKLSFIETLGFSKEEYLLASEIIDYRLKEPKKMASAIINAQAAAYASLKYHAKSISALTFMQSLENKENETKLISKYFNGCLKYFNEIIKELKGSAIKSLENIDDIKNNNEEIKNAIERQKQENIEFIITSTCSDLGIKYGLIKKICDFSNLRIIKTEELLKLLPKIQSAGIIYYYLTKINYDEKIIISQELLAKKVGTTSTSLRTAYNAIQNNYELHKKSRQKD